MTIRHHRNDEGFSLIEVVIVIAVIGILIASAIPTMGYVRKRSAEKSAMSSAMAGFASSKSVLLDLEDWTNAPTTAMSAAEPTLSFTRGPAVYSTGSRAIAYDTNVNSIKIAVFAGSGTCFRIYEVQGSPAKFGKEAMTNSALCIPAVVTTGSW